MQFNFHKKATNEKEYSPNRLKLRSQIALAGINSSVYFIKNQSKKLDKFNTVLNHQINDIRENTLSTISMNDRFQRITN